MYMIVNTYKFFLTNTLQNTQVSALTEQNWNQSYHNNSFRVKKPPTLF